MITVQNDLVLVKNRRTAKAVHAGKRTGPDRPSLLPVKVVRGGEHLVAIEEGDIHQFAISRRRARSKAVERVLVLQRRVEDGLFPAEVARLAVKAEQQTGLGIRVGGDGKDTVSLDDRRGVAETG